MRGNTGNRHADKGPTAIEAEASLVAYLCGARPVLRPLITVDTLVAKFKVQPKVAQYRLQLAQQRWRAE
jgi:hypothetical protein